MPARKQRDHHALHDDILTDDDFGDTFTHSGDEFLGALGTGAGKCICGHGGQSERARDGAFVSKESFSPQCCGFIRYLPMMPVEYAEKLREHVRQITPSHFVCNLLYKTQQDRGEPKSIHHHELSFLHLS